MKKLILAMALVVALLSTACSGGGNTAPAPREAAAPTTDTAYCGTYQGTLPAADCPGIKTVLTIAADSTYTLSSQYIDRQAQPVVTSGVYHLKQGGKLIELVTPSSGEKTYYKIKDAKSIVMTDSAGIEPQGPTAKFYVLTR
ncbi:copper resistance protein NlpE [Sodaliphilus pleomorphus]|uniref:copper resistance protein NlpE n=1 Tax=Sodaliphilus pleomorphus TaxID=2606626 RepID=UPI00240A840E|nr:copper resistance protein NlpE [Sodaliphilus pleomorphus]MDD6687181.1 copper resistance protein NlpE [Sodaliphilus pleomorphus]